MICHSHNFYLTTTAADCHQFYFGSKKCTFNLLFKMVVVTIQTLLWRFRIVKLNNLWQRGTTQRSLIGIFSTLGKLSYGKYLSIRINQVNLKVNLHFVPQSKMSVWWEKTSLIFFLNMQKKHIKISQWTKSFKILVSIIILDQNKRKS